MSLKPGDKVLVHAEILNPDHEQSLVEFFSKTDQWSGWVLNSMVTDGKVVPKDAVVLDIYDDERVSLPKFLNEIMGWIRQGLVNNIAGGTGVLERIRDQIEEQTKPRIPEPGWGEKVIAHTVNNSERLRWVRFATDGFGGKWWVCENNLEYDRTWEDLLDPELV